MQAVDEPVYFVEFPSQRRLVSTVLGGPANRRATTPQLSRFDPAGDVIHLLVQLTQQCHRLRAPRIIDHELMVSSILNVCLVSQDIPSS
jgi:hypothetical protein